jgi:biopolymer transport protein ExbD
MSLQRWLPRRRGGEDREINIAPLIDMVFILLIFFMVTTTFTRDHQIDVSRPQAHHAAPAAADALRVGIALDGRISLDGERLYPWMIRLACATRCTGGPGAACWWWPTNGWRPSSWWRWSTNAAWPGRTMSRWR